MSVSLASFSYSKRERERVTVLGRRSAPTVKTKAMRWREMMMAKIDTETAISANMLSSLSTHSITHSIFWYVCVSHSFSFFTLYLSLSLSLLLFLFSSFFGHDQIVVKIIASALIIQICVTVTEEDGDDLRARGSDGPWRFVDWTTLVSFFGYVECFYWLYY